MPRITLARALTLKNRVVSTIGTIDDRIRSYNSIVSGASRTYDPKQQLDRRDILVNGLVQLKRTIQQSNEPIAEDIFRLSEAKGRLVLLRTLNVKSGKEIERSFMDGGTATIEYHAVIEENERDKMVAEIQSEIDDTQQRLDMHNHTTEIDVPEFDLT